MQSPFAKHAFYPLTVPWSEISLDNTVDLLSDHVVFLRYHIYHSLRSGRIWHKVNFFLNRSLTGLKSEFSFSLTSCLTKAEEPNLSYYLPIAVGRIIGFIPFPRVLVLCEMQSVSSRIWTRVAVSISYDDNHYTTGTSTIFKIWTTNQMPIGVKEWYRTIKEVKKKGDAKK